MTALKVKASALSFLVKRYYRRKRERKNICRWYHRHHLLLENLDKEDRLDWLVAAVLTILLLVMAGWYFYFLYQWAPYVWSSG